MVILWAVFMAAINTVFAHIGLDLNFLFYFMAVCTSGSVFPIGLLMCWKRLNKAGAIAGVLGGLIMGFVGWLVTAQTVEGAITITTLTASKAILAGSLSALGTGALVSIGVSLVRPADFDFALTRAIGSLGVHAGTTDPSSPGETEDKEQGAAPSAPIPPFDSALTKVEGGGRTALADAEYAEGVEELEKSQTKFRIITGAILLVIRELPGWSRG